MEEESNLVYFQKELVSNPVNLARGGSVRWESIGDDEGVLATKVDWLIAELRAFSARKIGGIKEITREAYDAKKNSAVLDRRPRQRLADPPLFPPVRSDIRDAPRVAAEVFPTPKPPERKASPEYVQALVPGDAAPADPAANRPVARKIPKLPKADNHPSILP